MVRDKNPTLDKTCVICRSRIVCKLNVSSKKEGLTWKVLCAESLCMLFGLPKSHPFVSLFVNESGESKSQLCSKCYSDVADMHHIFWQLTNLETRLSRLQGMILGRLRWNYDVIPCATVFAQMGEEDVSNNLENLNYDDIVKILFEKIKDSKKWPKPVYVSRWKQAMENAEILSESVLKAQAQMPNIENNDASSPVKIEGYLRTNYSMSLEDHDYRIASPPPLSPENYPTEEEEEHVGTADDVKIDTNHEDEDEDVNESTNENETSKKHYFLRQRPTRKKAQRKGKQQQQKAQPLRNETTADTRYLCVEDPDNCSRTYSNKKHLKNHIKTFHEERKFSCDYEGCHSIRFQSEERLLRHKEKIHEKKRSTEICDTCGAEVPRGDLKKHFYLRHLGVGKYSCDRCSMDFNEPDDLKKHKELHEQAAYPFLCVVCQKLFTNSLDLKTHVSGNHRLSGIKCTVCGIMKANDYLLQRHMKLHNRSNRFMCECGKSFASKGYLQYHQEHHHNNSGRKYPCSVCGKAFTHQKNTLRHMVTHSEDKPFQCSICLKKFNYSHLLKKHEEIHSGTKNYGCEICGKRFRQEQNLRQHMRSHRPKPDKPMKQTTEPGKTEEAIPVILDVKSDFTTIEAGTKREDDNDNTLHTNIVTLLPMTVPQTSIVHASDVVHSTQSFMLQQPPPHGTTTVVFVTDPQNIQWIQE